MYFDARKAKALKPGENYAIDGCPGLRMEAMLTKKTWVYRYKSPLDGKLKQIRIGSWPAMPPVDAATNWQKLRERREAGEDPALEKKQAKFVVRSGPDLGYTQAQMITDYYEEHLRVNRTEKGATLIVQRLRKAHASHDGMLASRTSRGHVHDVINGMAETPVLAKSVRAETAAAWEHAVNAGRIHQDLANWWAQVKFKNLKSKGAMRDGKRKGTAKRILRPGELSYLFKSQMHLFSPQVQDFLVIQQWTCARGGEICQMHIDHISEESGLLWWTLPKELTKGTNHESATDLRVPLIGRAEVAVRRRMGALLPEDGGWLFASKTRNGTRTYVKQAYMQSKVHYRQPYSNCRPDHVRERLRVTHWSPHDLRRTGRTMLAGLKCPEEIAEAIIGHVKPGVVGVYNLYAYDPERVEWLTTLNLELERVIAASWPQYSPGEAIRR